MSLKRGRPLNTVEMNWQRTFKIWWYWLWRATLATLVVAFIVGFFLGLFLSPFIGSEATGTLIMNLVGVAIGVFFGLWVLKSLPDKQFSDFRVVLVARDPEHDGDGA